MNRKSFGRIAAGLGRGLAVVSVLVLGASASVGDARGTARRPVVDPRDFVREIDNLYMPLDPGTTLHYEGTKDGLPASDDFFVTHRTKVIVGVRCIEVRDRAFDESGDVVEETFDWFAQDRSGNVWYFGEDATEFEGGVPISHEGSWQAGVDGAEPGIVMQARRRVGMQYRQESAPGVAEDMARTLSLDEEICVPYGCFDDVLLTKEWSPLKPGVVEHKWYAPGIGLIKAKKVKGGQEVSRLVSVTEDDDD
jgi:hypothetical protein